MSTLRPLEMPLMALRAARREDLRTQRNVLGLGLGIIGCFVAVLAVGARGATKQEWLAALCVAWVLALAWTLTRREFSLGFAAVVAEMFVFVVRPALGHILRGHTSIASQNYDAGTVEALRIALVGQIALLGGAVLARTLWPSRFLRLRAPLSISRLDAAAGTALAVGLLGVLLFAAVSGANLSNFLVFTTSSGAGAFYRSGTGAKVEYFLAMQVAGGLALALIALRFTSGARRRRLVPLVIAAGVVLVLASQGVRGPLVVCLIVAGFVWFKTTAWRIGARRLAVGGLVAVLAVAALLGVARGAAGKRHLTPATLLAYGPLGSASDDFAPLAGLAQTIPARMHYLDGKSYLETFVFAVPRALWPGKPVGSISQVTLKFDPTNDGLALPEFGEMYANFGLPGVLLGSVLLGVLVEGLWLGLANARGLRMALASAVLLAVCLQIFVRGDVAPMLAPFAGLILAAAVLCLRRIRVLDPVGGQTAASVPSIPPPV